MTGPTHIGNRAVHPYAATLPWPSEAALAQLKESIQRNGLLHPVVLDKANYILAGRSRAFACRELGIEPTTTVFEGDNALEFFLADETARRHMNESQRAMSAARLAEYTSGLAIEEVAARFCVSRALFFQAKRVLRSGCPPLIALIDAGELKVGPASEVAGLERRKLRVLAQRGAAAVRSAAQRRRASGKADASTMDDTEADTSPDPCTPAAIELAVGSADSAVTGEPPAPDDKDTDASTPHGHSEAQAAAAVEPSSVQGYRLPVPLAGASEKFVLWAEDGSVQGTLSLAVVYADRVRERSERDGFEPGAWLAQGLRDLLSNDSETGDVTP